MAINITIVKTPEGVVPAEASKSFDENGGSLGRGVDNQWVLSDPERFLSSKHCQISCDNGHYFLTDCSTNGTFINGSSEPIGRNSKVALKDGDTFDMGDYQFSVSVWALESASASPFDAQQTSRGDIFGTGSTGQDAVFPPSSSSSDPFGDSPFPAELYNSVPEESDPLAALDKAGLGNNADPFGASSSGFTDDNRLGGNVANDSSDLFSSNSYSDGADAINQAASWPSTTHDSALIPEDWDDDLMSSGPSESHNGPAQISKQPPIPEDLSISRSLPLTDRPSQEPKLREKKARSQQAPPPAKSRIPLEQGEAPARPRPASRPTPSARKPAAAPSVDKARRAQNARPAGATGSFQTGKAAPVAPKKAAPKTQRAGTVDRAVIDAIGLEEFELSDERIQEINAVVGEMVRETVIGMMQSLRSRATIKNEFRMNVTTIQPIENNPLKFSANIDDALENMFIKQSNAYKKPVEAVREGFQAVAEHQVALLAGIRSAFKSMVEGFDPEKLEKQFERQSKGSIVPALGKAKYWNAYKEHYQSLADNMESSFQFLFGDEFVQAYEDQLIRLSKSRDKR